MLYSVLIPFNFKMLDPILLKSYAVLDRIKNDTQRRNNLIECRYLNLQ